MTKPDKSRGIPGVTFQPGVYQGIQKGINTIADAIRPTLGPIHRVVAIEKVVRGERPELLDEGAVIARRIIQLPHRTADMGAMYLRQVLWEMYEMVGDGTATAAVLFQTIYNEGLRYTVAGGDAMRLRQSLDAAAEVILHELEGMVIQLSGKERLARLAETICYDPALAKMLGEIFDNIGAYGRLEIRSGRSQELERDYVEGMYWDGGLFSRAMILDTALGKVQLDNVPILITDLGIDEPQELFPVLAMAVRAEIKNLILIANSISDRAMSVLLTEPNRQRIQVVAVKAPAFDITQRSAALEDLAILTGGRAFFQAAGYTLNSVRAEDLGHARRAWADRNNFGIVGGKGDPRQLRQHIATLRAGLARLEDAKERKRLQERIGKLMGGCAVLWVGDQSPLAIEARQALAERTAEAMRGAMREGVLPGGGTALLACQPLIQNKMRAAENAEERVAYNILLQAVETPFRAILANAGFNPEKALAQIDLAGVGFGFDVVRGHVADMAQSGIYDAASVVKTAVSSAIRGAALALTLDVLVHHKNPPLAQRTI